VKLINTELLNRFSQILGIVRRPPSVDALSELVGAFMYRVPFENISKLLYKKRLSMTWLPDLGQYLDGIERYNFGGTCYANNSALNCLLTHLGYDVRMCGADMSDQDVHLVNLVRVDGREFLVDAGYAAPFVRPIPRDKAVDQVIALGRERYVLRPAGMNGCSRMDLYRDGDLVHGYTIKPTPRTIDHFAPIVAGSFVPESEFMKSVLVVRWYPNRSVAVRNLSVIVSEGAEYRIERLSGRDQLPEAIEKHFAIPREIVAEAVAGLDKLDRATS